MKYLSVAEIVRLTLAFLLFGCVSGLLLNLSKSFKAACATIDKRNQIHNSADKYLSNKKKTANNSKKIRFSIFEAILVFFWCIIFFLFSFYFLDGDLRLYTLAISILGFILISLPFKAFQKPISVLLYPFAFFICRASMLIKKLLAKLRRGLLYLIKKSKVPLRCFWHAICLKKQKNKVVKKVENSKNS